MNRIQPAIRLWLIAAAGIVTLAWGMPGLLQALLILFAGVLFANFLTRLTAYLVCLTPFGYGVSYALVIATMLAIVICGAYYLGSRVLEQVGTLLQELNRASANLENRFEIWQDNVELLDGQKQSVWTNRLMSTAASAAWLTIVAGGSIVVTAFLSFYFALQPGLYRRGFLALFPAPQRDRVQAAIDRLSIRLWRWILGRMVGMLVIGVTSTMGLWLLGVPLPITLGVFAGLMNFVPNVGPIIAAIPAILLGMQQGVNVAVYVLVLYFVLQFLESYFLTPLIDQHQVSLPPGLLLASQFVLGSLAGILGLFLATPLTIVTVVLIRALHFKEP